MATFVTVFIHTRKSKSADAWAVPSRDWLYFFVYSARELRPGDAARTVQTSLGRTLGICAAPGCLGTQKKAVS